MIEITKEQAIAFAGASFTASELLAVASAVQAQTRKEVLEEVDKKLRYEIDHAIMNDIKLPPAFGKRFGDPAIRIGAVEAVLGSLFRSLIK